MELHDRKSIQADRMAYALDQLNEKGIDVHYQDESEIRFMWNGSEVKFYPYKGWHTGKTIKDGRGLKKLLDQLV